MSISAQAESPEATNSERWSSAMLVVGHPGHELRVHAWMEVARPIVCILTDGSGHTGEGRLESTTRVLARTGSRPGPVYGRMSDREIYQAILDQDLGRFCQLADELCASIVALGASCVVGDAAEGYNPSHDVCRLVINAAVRMASRARSVPIETLDFLLVGAPDALAAASSAGSVRLSLSDGALARKLESANGYPEMTREVASALERFGVAPFAHEVLRAVDLDDRLAWTSDERPFYEQYGEKRVEEGVYDRVLRVREHVGPLAETLWSHSTRGR
jgi:hypothetical protein